MPLEGLWWADPPESFALADKSEWYWTVMILQPDFVTRAVQERPHGAVRPISEVEQSHVLRALRAAEGNKSRAAQMLGIDRSTLYAKLKRYGLAGPDPDGDGGRESPAARP